MTKKHSKDNHGLPFKEDTPLTRAMMKAALKAGREGFAEFEKASREPNPRPRPQGGPLKLSKYAPPTGKKR